MSSRYSLLATPVTGMGEEADEREDEGDEDDRQNDDDRNIIQRRAEHDHAQQREDEEHEAADRREGPGRGVGGHWEVMSNE